MKRICNSLLSVIILIIIVAIGLTGCSKGNSNKDLGFSLSGIQEGKEPTKEERARTIELSNKIISEVKQLGEVKDSAAFINETSVLIGVRLMEESKEISPNLHKQIEEKVKVIYPEVIDIAITSKKESYEIIEDLLDNFIDVKKFKELKKDLREIIGI